MTLLALPPLASIATPEDAAAIGAAARAAGKPPEVAREALLQLAGKVAGGLWPATRDAAVRFVVAARVGPGLARCGHEEHSWGASGARPDTGPLPPEPDRGELVRGWAGVLRAVGG